MLTDENANPNPNNDSDSDDPGRESTAPQPLSPEEYAEAQKDARREGSGS